MKRNPPARGNHRGRGFTYVELIVALGIGAAIVATAVVAYGTITRFGAERRTREDVRLNAGVLASLYGMNGTSVSVNRAPSYSDGAMAEALRNQFWEDVDTATAVYCLARTDPAGNSVRVTNLAMTNSTNARTLSSPEAFRSFLAGVLPASSGTFVPFSGAATNTGTSIYVLNTSTNLSAVNVRSIYEVDLLATTSPAGIYATVRRYQGTNCTGYYHAFYSGATNTGWPLAAYFRKSAIPGTGVAANDAYLRAAERPFYFLWWPDPMIGRLPPAPGGVPPDFTRMGGATSFFFVVPAFPAL